MFDIIKLDVNDFGRQIGVEHGAKMPIYNSKLRRRGQETDSAELSSLYTLPQLNSVMDLW